MTNADSITPSVFIVGVARSGTTWLYRIAQQVFRECFGQQFTSTYEPFIWNWTKFNRAYEDCHSLFGKTASLSTEGIYAHQKIPMFIQVPEAAERYLWSPLFRHLSAAHGPDTPHVAKFIRANGRLPLLRALNPHAKIILSIRNPIDLVNSVKHKFSYFGDDFYPSDFARFCRERSGQLLLNEAQNSWAERQAEYALQMTAAALDFASTDSQTLVLDYDARAKDAPRLLQDFCEFLSCPVHESIVQVAQTRTGPTTHGVNLSRDEFDDACKYLDAYAQLDGVVLDSGALRENLNARYQDQFSAEPLDEALEGLTTNRLRNLLLQARHQ